MPFDKVRLSSYHSLWPFSSLFITDASSNNFPLSFQAGSSITRSNKLSKHTPIPFPGFIPRAIKSFPDTASSFRPAQDGQLDANHWETFNNPIKGYISKRFGIFRRQRY